MIPLLNSRPVALLLVLGLPVLAGDAPAKKDLRVFFSHNCVVCHGVDGSARGADGSRLKGQDFTDARDMKGLSDSKMAKTIRKGLFFGKRMPSFKSQLSEAEALDLVQQVLRKVEKGKPVYSETPLK